MPESVGEYVFCTEFRTCNNECKPLYQVASSKLARKTHIDMLNKVQIKYYAAGLHRTGSDGVFRYTSLELPDRNVLMKAAFEGCEVQGFKNSNGCGAGGEGVKKCHPEPVEGSLPTCCIPHKNALFHHHSLIKV